MKHAGRRARAGAAVLLILALATTSCSGDDDSDSDSPEPAQSTAPGSAFAIETETTVDQVAGRLSRADRQRLARSVTEVAQSWFNAAYVGGTYPRSDFSNAFPGFTPGARADAQRDYELMTNKLIGPKIDDVTPTRSRIWIDVLSPRKRAVAVTARFRLGFRTEGDLVRDVTVRGRLLLTRQPGSGWKIFGYHVAREAQA